MTEVLMPTTPANFYDLTRAGLLALATRWGFPPVHAARLWAYAYLEGGVSWAEMPELPARFRARPRHGAINRQRATPRNPFLELRGDLRRQFHFVEPPA